MDTKQFIIEVKKRRPLWDQTNKFYHNKKVLHDKWKEIATSFGIEVQTAKQKWKNLRDTFRVELKKTRRFNIEGGEKSSPWGHYEDMLFLKDVLKTRKLRDLIDATDADTMIDTSSEPIKVEQDVSMSPSRLFQNADENKACVIESVASITQSQVQDVDTTNQTIRRTIIKRKRSFEEDNNATENNDEEQDDDMLFFRSLLPFVKKLDQDKKLLFRMNVQQMLYNQLYNNQ